MVETDVAALCVLGADMRLAAALYGAGLARAEHLVSVATALLTAGHHGRALTDLACTSEAALRDVAPLFEAALREAGVPTPSRSESCDRLAAHIGARIMSGDLDVGPGVSALVDLAWLGEGRERDLLGLWQLLDQLSAHDDGVEPSTIARIRAHLEVWMTALPTPA